MFRSAALLAVITLAATPAWAVPSTTIAVSGLVGTPGTLSAGSLQALPQVTQMDSYTAAGSPVVDTFTGPTLWSVLQAQGGIVTNRSVKNDVLQSYVVVTGTDGYKAVVSAGEISPSFGNKPDLLAIQDTSGALPGSNGLARLTTPGDKAGGRYVSNVASVTVGHGPIVAGIGGGTTSSFVVQGSVSKGISFTLAGLQALTPHTETVTYQAGGSPVIDTYTGALLWDVLSQAGIVTDPSIKNDILRIGVVATGSDGYSVDFAAGELSPMFGSAPILVAYSDVAGQLGNGGSSGFARLVVPGDIAGGRYVSNLSSLTVFDATAVPEPVTFLLLGPAAAMVGLFRAGASVRACKRRDLRSDRRGWATEPAVAGARLRAVTA